MAFEQMRELDIAPAREVRRVDNDARFGVKRAGRANTHPGDVLLPPRQLDQPLDQMYHLAVAGPEPSLRMSWHDQGLHQMPLQSHQPSCHLCSPNIDTHNLFRHNQPSPE